jgi:hypothetical protein
MGKQAAGGRFPWGFSEIRAFGSASVRPYAGRPQDRARSLPNMLAERLRARRGVSWAQGVTHDARVNNLRG